ncbi:unnamed protein product, partial [Closterium sp. NIES-54]
MERPRCLGWSLLRIAVSSMVLAFFATVARAANVTITHLRLDTTHDSPYAPWDPSVYFQCDGEMKHVLQGVVQANVTYNFTGQEEFQNVQLHQAQGSSDGFQVGFRWVSGGFQVGFRWVSGGFQVGF